jgi:ABC-type phosphate transport system permease subunit
MMDLQDVSQEVLLEDRFADNIGRRTFSALLFKLACGLAVALGFILLFVLLWRVVAQGYEHLSFEFLQRFPSRLPSRAGLKLPYTAACGF